MRVTLGLKLGAVLAAAVAVAMPQRAEAQGNPVEPYILFIVDVSASMGGTTGFGSPSCAIGDTRLNHAKCAVQDIVNGYGDMVMGFGRFRHRTSDTNPGNGCNVNGVICSPCQADPINCTPPLASGDRFELLVPLVDQNENEILEWVDDTVGTCFADQSAQPELFAAGATPLKGTVEGAQRYFQGLNTPGIDPVVGVQSYVPPFWGGQGDDPIRDDPLKLVFDSPGQQCRPYIVVLLTDGDETCVADFAAETLPAVSSLLSTDVDGLNYRIEVKPIGLGKNPGDSDIEALAHAGGAADGPGNEGFYAQNQEELALAVAQIVSDALRFEVCNEADDDCDLMVDEDFPAKGTACDDGADGICKSTGTRQCTADGTGVECIIDTPGQAPQTEVCLNGIDEDCDGQVDENCGGCTAEVCNNLDDDCDGQTDENLTRPCGEDTGICTTGTETCINGTFQGCTGVPPAPAEVCNNLDDDCDGTVDGLSRSCGVSDVGECQLGSQLCPAGGGGFGPCIGNVDPVPEQCDLRDNDCDGDTDEDTGGDACNSTCGVGVTECENGVLVCSTTFDPSDEVCDNLDNDCDGTIDEDVPDAGACNDPTLCEDGTLMCISGGFVCVGGVEPANEICDCEDNNCNGQVDEGGPSMCPPGASCVECQCAFPCEPGEFPCPLGKFCSEDNFCLNDPCFGIDCLPDANGDATTCVEGACVRTCDVVDCPGGLACRPSDGVCVADNCEQFPEKCSADEVCSDQACVSNPCFEVDCPSGQYCSLGECYASCADILCPIGQKCELGACVPDRCGLRQCGDREFCNPDNGQCEADPCADLSCEAGEVCDSQTGACTTDPCLGVDCPGDNEGCDFGTCFALDGPRRQHVTPGGAGCSAGGATGTAFALLFSLFAVANIRRRRDRHA